MAPVLIMMYGWSNYHARLISLWCTVDLIIIDGCYQPQLIYELSTVVDNKTG